MEEHFLSDSKRRLCALLHNLEGCVNIAPKRTCDVMFCEVASFARKALAERNRRMEREQPERVMLLHVPVVKRDRDEEEDKMVMFCQTCSQHYRLEQLCDRCNAGFRWCCAGYSREPCEDPLYPATGVKIMLQAFCRACLEEKGLTADCVLQQEEEYLRILKVFMAPDFRWRWISCLSDGWSIFSVIWTALEECDDIESRTNPKFHEFVLGCADQALRILARETQDGVHVQAWVSLKAHPEVPPSFAEADFDLVWRATADHLNLSTATRICIWECEKQVLECKARYGDLGNQVGRVINVLKWNRAVSTHFDLLIPVEDVQQQNGTGFGVEGSAEFQ